MKKTETFLPVFPGFYETIFESNFESELEYLKEELTNLEYELVQGELYSLNCYYDAVKEYELQVCHSVTSIIETELKAAGFIKSISFQELVSPKYYNFQNNSINIEVTFSKKNIKNIEKFVNDHIEEYKQYLEKKYTSYDGFISFHDNYISEEWEVKNAIEASHNCGALLEFICQVSEIDEWNLYENMEVYSCVDIEKIKEELQELFPEKFEFESEEEKEKYLKVKNERELDKFQDQLKLF